MVFYGQEGTSFDGPGLISHATVESFRKIVNLTSSIKGNDTTTIRGDLAVRKDHTPHLFNGKKTMVLFDAHIWDKTMKSIT